MTDAFGKHMALYQREMRRWSQFTRKRKWSEPAFPILDFDQVPLIETPALWEEFEDHGFIWPQ